MDRPADRPPDDHLQRLFELSRDMLGTTSANGWLTSVNPAWERTLGWTAAELTSRPLVAFVHAEDLEATNAWIATLAGVGAAAPITFENRLRTRAGSYRVIRWISASGGGWYFAGTDVTGLRAAEGSSGDAASLTRAILDSVADGVYVADSAGRVTFINPAGARILGYDAPDQLLGLPPHATFHHSRWDGSPFPIAECDLAGVRQTGHTVRSNDDAFWRRDGMPVPVAYSSAPIDLGDGTGSVVAFRDITALQAETERLRVVARDTAGHDDLAEAIAEDRLVLYGQPIVDMTTGEPDKHELLLRMHSRAGDLIPPDRFLPVAEAGGLIVAIDRWVVSHALELAAGGRSVSVNLSASSVGSIELLRHIERELTRTGADAGRVTFEVTETAIMGDLQEGRRFAERLVALGCSFSLDDFGTGYGSLTYLRQLPFSYVKIDMQFVRGLMTSEPDRRFVRAITQIAQSLGQRTVAEGVEDEATLGLLRGVGVDFVQGYHLGRPAPLDA